MTLLARLFSFPSTHLASCRPPLPSIISGLPVIRPECELATNPTVEGEATDTYLSEQRKRAGVKVTGSPCVSRACARQSCTGSGAQVTFSGGAVRAAHLDRLAKYLELAKLALEAEEEE